MLNGINMWQRVIAIILAIVLTELIIKTSADMIITRLQCEVIRPGVGVFEECYAKPLTRTKKVVNIRFHLQQQVKKCLIKIEFVKKANGWKPFLYNITFDACDFMRHPSKYPIPYYVYLVGRAFTDVNHTCPYEAGSYMNLKNLQFSESLLLSFIPLEVGEYGIQTVWHINKEPVAKVNGYINYRDYRKI